jgi:hypothetical protein
MRKRSLILLFVAVLALTIPSAALAAPAGSVPKNCWGVVTSQRARIEGGIGEHTSSQATPRLGLGNVARLFYNLGLISDPHVSSLGALLAQLDEYDQTVCPVQQL